MSKILIVSPTPTHPPTAGDRSRVLSMADILRKQGHEVHFLHMARDQGDENQMRAYWGERFYSVKYCWPNGRPQYRYSFYYWLRRALRLASSEAPHAPEHFDLAKAWDNQSYWLQKGLRSLSSLTTFSKYNCNLDEWYNDAVDERISELQCSHNFDAVIAVYVYVSRALLNFGDTVVKAIDAIDVFSNRYRQYLSRGEEPVFYSISPADERKGLDRADVVLAIQPEEERRLSHITNSPVAHVGHCVPVNEPVDSPRAARILFVGSSNSINVEGITHFFVETFPLIRSKLTEATLLLAGRICDKVPDWDATIKLGVLDDLKSAYERADIVINPRTHGTGLSIKSIEAMGQGKPLVSTTAGCTGLEHAANEAFMLADTPTNFADAVVRILSEPELYRRFSRAGIAFVNEYNEGVSESLVATLSRQRH